MKKPKVCVVLPTNRPLPNIQATLYSCAMLLEPDFFEVVVVDTALDRHRDENDRLADCVAQLPHGRLFHDAQQGLLAGRVRGHGDCSAEVLVFIDDDISLCASWPVAVRQSFSDPTVALVGGPSEPEWEGTVPDWLHGFIRYRGTQVGECGWLSLLNLGDERQTIHPNYVWGLNFAIRRSVLEECGGFHPDCMPDSLQHFQGDGETGLTEKIAARGWKAVYDPRMKVRHRIGPNRLTPVYFFRRAFYQGVCESYTKLRIQHGVEPPARSHGKRRWFGRIRDKTRRVRDRWAATFTSIRKECDFPSVKEGTDRAHRAGREFHRIAFDSCPAVRGWVLKPDYWDYKLPESRFDAAAVRRACLARHAVPTIW